MVGGEVGYINMVHQAILIHNQEWLGEFTRAGLMLDSQIEECQEALLWTIIFCGRLPSFSMPTGANWSVAKLPQLQDGG